MVKKLIQPAPPGKSAAAGAKARLLQKPMPRPVGQQTASKAPAAKVPMAQMRPPASKRPQMMSAPGAGKTNVGPKSAQGAPNGAMAGLGMGSGVQGALPAPMTASRTKAVPRKPAKPVKPSSVPQQATNVLSGNGLPNATKQKKAIKPRAGVNQPGLKGYGVNDPDLGGGFA